MGGWGMVLVGCGVLGEDKKTDHFAGDGGES